MTNLEIAVKVISDGLERELSDYDYYKEYNITNWSQMLNAFSDAFGWNSKDVKNEIIRALQIYSKENNVNCNLSNLPFDLHYLKKLHYNKHKNDTNT